MVNTATKASRTPLKTSGLQFYHFHKIPPSFDFHLPSKTALHFQRARDAYYQGFITIWEFNVININNAYINNDGVLVFKKPARAVYNVIFSQKLTSERTFLIRGNRLLGLSDGKTLYRD